MKLVQKDDSFLVPFLNSSRIFKSVPKLLGGGQNFTSRPIIPVLLGKTRTSINKLYASGECAHTGLHGANRLASISLLEALVFSHHAESAMVERLESIPVEEFQQESTLQIDKSKDENDILNNFEKELNYLMSYNLLYTSEENGKKKALMKLKFSDEKLEKLCKNRNSEFFELQNMIQTAILNFYKISTYIFPWVRLYRL